jgi:predicted Zn-dependent peptidase
MEDEVHGDSHFLEHMLLEAPGRGGFHPLTAELELEAMLTNGATSVYTTRYNAHGLPEHMPRALQAFVQMVFNPEFTESAMEAERLVILQEEREARPHGFARWRTALRLPQMVPFLPSLGTHESIGRISRDGLLRHHATHYGAQNTMIVVAGPHKHEEVLGWVSAAQLPVASVVIPVRGNTLYRQLDDTAVFEDPNQADTLVLLFEPGPTTEREMARLQLTLDVLRRGFVSVLMRILRSEHSIAYSVGAGISDHPHPLLEMGIISVRDKHARVEELVMEGLRQVASGNIPEDAWRHARAFERMRQYTRGLPKSEESADRWVDRFAFGRFSDEPELDQLTLTQEDLAHTVQEHFLDRHISRIRILHKDG